MDGKTQRIAELNDEFRASAGLGDHVYKTPGIQALPLEDQLHILSLVKNFNDFSEDNNPYGEHDFGAFDYGDERVYWKIDYYDQNREYGSEDPSDPNQTTRVMTVMLAHEY